MTSSMSTACKEARQWMGSTSPNPPVGAVALDAEGQCIAIAAHHRAGELHAEAKLIEACGGRQIHTIVVTLEPCNHHGRTPPCADAIIRSGVKRVIIGTRDPNPHVKGGGIERLRQAGIEVVIGEDEAECKQLIHAFAYHVQNNKPWITVKRAFDTLHSMIPAKGQKTFTSAESLRLAHRLRKKADAIVTGSGTILADNPLFTVRHTEDYAGKKRWLAILDRRGRVPESYLAEAAARGFLPVITTDIHQAIADLNAKGAQDILVEAGHALSTAILNAGLWVMRVDIRQGNPDRIAVDFNPSERLPFDAAECNLEFMLPE